MRTLKIPAVICLICICLSPTASNVMGSFTADPPPPAISLSTLSLPPQTGQGRQVLPPAVTVVESTVKQGQAISQILDPYLPLKTVYTLDRESRAVYPLQKIRPGQPYKIFVESGRMTRFEYDITSRYRLVIQEADDHFSISKTEIAHILRMKTVTGRITSNLHAAMRKAGETGELADRLAAIFAWDINFIRDVRPGDHFSLLVETRYHQDKFSGYGRIKAARFSNRGKVYHAFWHRGANGCCGYYDETGRSLAKTFLKAPLDYSRISSRFSLKRMHPVLKEFRPHPAVDYAAPTGTPIKAVGEGVVAAMGYSKTMGNHVTLRHSGGYETRYFHMNGFAAGMKRGCKVAQGKVIGYVGMTGYATGPHLCFRMTVNGKPVDPLGGELPSGDPVAPEEMAAFQATAGRLLARLDSSGGIAASAMPSS